MSESNGEQRPGFLRMAGSLLRAPFEERMAREDHARFERLSLQAASQTLEEVVRRVTPEDDGFTDNMLGKPGARELEPETAETLRKKAIEASLKSAHMVGYLRSMARFVIGKGPEFSPVDMPDETTEAMSNWWGKFKVINKWDEQLEDEIPLRTWRDGETFIRRFEQIDEGPPEEWEPAAKQLAYLRGLGLGVDETELQPEDIPEGMVILRLIPADQITDPQNKISHGILTAAKDVCTVLAYLWAPDGTKVEEVIAAKEVMHVKIRVDQDVKRGRSLLEPILKRNKQYEDWLEYRVILNLVRAAVVLVKKVEGTAAQLSSVRSNHAPEREEEANTRRQKMLKPGTTVHATPGISYEFLTPNLQAQDAQHDGRNILLSEAAATGLPEYMFTGDASNSNFASTMTAEGPAIREFEAWQDFFAPVYLEIYRWVMKAAAEANQIEGLSAEDVDTMDVEIAYPPLLARDELKHTQANQIRHDAKVLSREGWAGDDGIDWAVEKPRIEAEREGEDDRDFDALARMAGRGDPDDEEDG